MKKIKIACTFIASMVGAGFASGREIALYFGESNPLIVILSASLCGFFCYVCLFLGKRGGGLLLPYLFGRTLPAADSAMQISNFVIYCAMIAGAEFLFFSAFSIHGIGVLTGLLAMINVLIGIEKVKFVNVLAVPLIIISLIIILLKVRPELYLFKGQLNIHSAFLYAGLNIFSGGYLVSGFAKKLSNKDCLKIGVWVAIALSLMLLAMFFVIQKVRSEDMPLNTICISENLTVLSVIILFLSIYTTMIGSLYIISKNRPERTILASSGGFIFSLFGFANIVNTVYPLIGAVGLAFTAIATIKWLSALRYDSRLSLSNGPLKHQDSPRLYPQKYKP